MQVIYDKETHSSINTDVYLVDDSVTDKDILKPKTFPSIYRLYHSYNEGISREIYD